MAAGVGIKDDDVRAALSRLIELADLSVQLRNDCAMARESQSGAWPQITSVQRFAGRFEQSIALTESSLDSVSTEISRLRRALLDSTTALQRQDEEIQLRFQQLAERLDREAGPAPRPVATNTPSTHASL